LYGRDCDAQHAAGGTRGGHDRVHVPRPPDRSERDTRVVRASPRDADRELHHREVRIVPQAAERKALEKSLQKLSENMVTLAELSELAIRKAIDGLTRRDVEVAREVFTLDQEVYGLQLEIERTCIDLIALHAPVARDLRTVTTSLKITTDLDRIGRYAKDLSELTLQFGGKATGERADVARIREMG